VPDQSRRLPSCRHLGGKCVPGIAEPAAGEDGGLQAPACPSLTGALGQSTPNENRGRFENRVPDPRSGAGRRFPDSQYGACNGVRADIGGGQRASDSKQVVCRASDTFAQHLVEARGRRLHGVWRARGTRTRGRSTSPYPDHRTATVARRCGGLTVPRTPRFDPDRLISRPILGDPATRSLIAFCEPEELLEALSEG
jgi:hypothetical protein